MKSIWGIAVAAAMVFYAAPAAAQDEPAAQKQEQARARIEQIKERLALTPEQTEQVRPVFAEEMQQLKALREKYNGKQNRRSRMKMAREAQGIVESADAKLKNILSKQQMAELKKVREEWRKELKERRKQDQG